MKNLYIIGEPKPLSKPEIEEMDNQISFSLPPDYKAFLILYGLGSINELVMMQQPDKDFIKSNFSDYMDFWTLTEKEEQLILNSLTIAATIDGDIITVINNNENSIVLLPRHSDEVIYFENLENVINYYAEKYKLGNDLYFDPSYNFEQEYISFIKNGSLNKTLFDTVHQIFLDQIPVDKSYNLHTQPKYIIQKIGGWVYFDNIGKSAVRVKYQKQFKTEADKIVKLINDQIK
ncbi:SMI1/KNR4 family protein [Flavobacterium johnsoniae]|uniref:SMI1-KNR4 cell-wall n=1 Tax=Flavobacterium johnsoniae TaxID=986 RepID=A0A1M5TUL1_FLAJO|nr:SMI1/KNR4 family protein [Flavobacterium johnsoniae]SHH54093.1 SMI1-KNR4 cell-wall [Flavobacterium johnsoniae]